MSENSEFMASINAFVEKAKANQEAVVRATSIKILARLVQMSPVGNPELWAVNQTAVAYNSAVDEHNSLLRQNPGNLTKAGRLRKGLKVNDGMDVKAPPGYTGGDFAATGKYLSTRNLKEKRGASTKAAMTLLRQVIWPSSNFALV